MNPIFYKFIKEVVQQTDGSKDEKADLQEELLTHLQLTYEQLMVEGLDKKEAEKKAMAQFGDAQKVGNELQQAMFPYRKEMLLTLASLSILFSFSVYIAQLIIEGDALITWLILAMLTSSFILLFGLQAIPNLNLRRWLNMTLTIHVFVFLFGLLAATSINHFLSVILTIIACIIMLLTLVLIYQTAVYSYQSPKQAKILHVVNISAGIIIISVTLFFIWGLLIFSTEFSPFMLLPLIPVTIWLISYIAQMKLVSKKMKKSANIIASIPVIIVAAMFLWYFSMILFL